MIGWMCPGCGRCYNALLVGMCGFCGPKIVITGSTTVCPSCGHWPCAGTHTGCSPR